MDIGATPAAVDSRSAAGGAGRAASIGTGADFTTFLQMLTVQLQNQDPLNPMESSDFAVQLATFSQVEQQVRTNELLDSLGTQLTVMGMSELAGWVGMEARASAPVMPSAAGIELALDPRPAADSAELVVSDGNGREVQRLPVDPRAGGRLWTGEGLGPGPFTLSLASHADGVPIGLDPVEHYATVKEARNRDGSVKLLLSTGAEVGATEVRVLRSPGR